MKLLWLLGVVAGELPSSVQNFQDEAARLALRICRTKNGTLGEHFSTP
jgi:hypothetical protein